MPYIPLHTQQQQEGLYYCTSKLQPSGKLRKVLRQPQVTNFKYTITVKHFVFGALAK
jgi:hypothetical protein